MFTEEELEYIKEQLGNDWYEKLVKTMEMADKGVQVEQELKENLYKIFTNPEAKEHLLNALSKAGIQVDIPKDPYEEQIKSLKKDLKEVEKKVEKSSTFQKVKEKLDEYGITEDEYEDLINFQRQYGIKDGLKAIELYAMFKKQKAYEVPPARFAKEMLSPETYSEEEAYKKTLEDFKKIIRG